MQLSKRLQMVTDFVTKGSIVADVGCDHAYISIYLIEHEISLKSYALDINRGPLKKARENIEFNGLTDRIETRLSDGLSSLVPGEANTIIIAGMGGALAVKILTEGEACVELCNELIIQAQSEVEKVRMYLHTIHYEIIKENMCIDDGKYYTAIHAINSKKYVNKKDSWNQAEVKPVYLKYGKHLLLSGNSVLYDFLQKENRKAETILETLKKQQTDHSKLRMVSLLEEMELMKEALGYFKS